MGSCTALVEHFDGRLEIVTWAERRDFDPFEPHRTISAEELLELAETEILVGIEA